MLWTYKGEEYGAINIHKRETWLGVVVGEMVLQQKYS